MYAKIEHMETETNTQKEQIAKPQLDNFVLSYDGKPLVRYELKRRVKYGLKLLAWASYLTFEAVYDVIDMVLQSVEQRRPTEPLNAPKHISLRIVVR